MHRFRLATRQDIPRILGIYGPYVEGTAVSFEYEVDAEEFGRQFGGSAAVSMDCLRG